MSCGVPTRRIVNDKEAECFGLVAVIMADKVDSSDVDPSSVTEESQHQDQLSNKDPPSSLPPLPRLHSSLPSPVSPPSDQAFLQASAIFQQLREEKPVALQLLHYGKKADTPMPESGDKATQRQAYQLAFNTLKYQDLLEDIIIDSCFHTSQQIPPDLLPLAMVMLFDLQDRRFLLRERSIKEGEESSQEVRDLESSLHRCKTKLAASLARCRVKQNLQSVSCFLSDPVRTKQHRAKRLPLYAWVNTLKASVDDVCEALRSAGVREAKDASDLDDSAFCRDSLCPDTLVLSQRLHALLQHSGLSSTHVLNVQDRSVCVAVSVLRPLLFDCSDVLVAGSFSAATVAHVAVAAAARSGRVLLCGADRAASQVEEIQELLALMDIKNVRVLSEAFCTLSEWDAAVQRLKVIMVLPQCSSSALSDPVPAIHSEHGDWDLLPDLCHGTVSRHKLQTMAAQQARLLAHALTFPKVQTVVYCTRSVYPEENEQLVRRVLEKTHTHPKLLPFRVNGPIFPVDSRLGEAAADSKFFRLEPSHSTNGCFVARLSRQADPTKVETVQDVLARAAAKGLLGGIVPEQAKHGKKGRSRKKPPSPPSGGREEQAGGESVTPPGQEEEKSDGGFEGSEEGRERRGDEEKAGKAGKKRRGGGLNGRKRRLRRRLKPSGRALSVSKRRPRSRGRRLARRGVSGSHHKRRAAAAGAKSKQRRIPRLTLTLMSSAKPSSHLSPITALAHRLADAPLVKSSPAPPPPPPAASRAGKAAKASPFEAGGEAAMARAREAMKATDSALPPLSSPSSGSLRSTSGVSASSSSVSLPAL